MIGAGTNAPGHKAGAGGGTRSWSLRGGVMKGGLLAHYDHAIIVVSTGDEAIQHSLLYHYCPPVCLTSPGTSLDATGWLACLLGSG